eukprot:3941425-Rhodomonas_salina.2
MLPSSHLESALAAARALLRAASSASRSSCPPPLQRPLASVACALPRAYGLRSLCLGPRS